MAGVTKALQLISVDLKFEDPRAAGDYILDSIALDGSEEAGRVSAERSSCLTRPNSAFSQGLMELYMVLPTPDTDEKNGLNLLRRLWVVKFDKEEEIRKLAER